MLLMVLFIITGGVYYGVAHTAAAPVAVVCVAICHFFFNFGKSSRIIYLFDITTMMSLSLFSLLRTSPSYLTPCLEKKQQVGQSY